MRENKGEEERSGLEHVQGPEVLALRVIAAHRLLATPSSGSSEALKSGLFGFASPSISVHLCRIYNEPENSI